MNDTLPKNTVSPDAEKIGSSETRTHHPYSPSTLNYLEWCPHYRGAQAETPHARTTAGTRAHGVVETGEDDQKLGDEDAVAAAECLDFVEQRRVLIQEEANRCHDILMHTAKAPQVNSDHFRVEELKELYVPVDDKVFPDCRSTTAGYFDRVLLCRGTEYAEGFDWKFGNWPVEIPSENLQVIAYSLGLFKRFPEINKVRFWIKQPLIGYVKDAVFERENIDALYLRVQTVVARARTARGLTDFSMAKPAVPICLFCSEIGRCNKVCEMACKVGRKFHPIDVPEDISPAAFADPNSATKGLRLASALKVWAESFRRQITDRVIAGEMSMPSGYKIQTLSKRELADMKKMREIALKYMTTAEFESTLECTFGAVESIVQEHAPRGQKTAMVKEFQSALESAGAVVRKEPFSFLKAITNRE